jgi:hypothetical protein
LSTGMYLAGAMAPLIWTEARVSGTWEQRTPMADLVASITGGRHIDGR